MRKAQFVTALKWAVPVVLACLALAWIWDHRHHVLERNFRAVEVGRIYAGGYQSPIPFRKIIQRQQIKTVLSLGEFKDDFEAEEQEVLAGEGVQFRRVIIPFKVAEEDRLVKIEEAVEIIANPANQPVFVHCWGGCHRTGAVVAVYRVKYCGWNEQAAEAELVQWGGTSLGTEWPTSVLHTFCGKRDATVASQPVARPIR